MSVENKLSNPTKLVVISSGNGHMDLNLFHGNVLKDKAVMTIDDSTTIDGIKEVIEEFRVS